MQECKKKLMKDAYKRYLESDNYCLSDCYNNFSYRKEEAKFYCHNLERQHQGKGGKIISYNLFAFTYGFIGRINDKDAFFYITRDYDRYIYLEDLED